ncbi:hypothetical protein VC83_05855 [Pseudogymnoascus destructans]|uniref:Clathrin light chain n=2 Tax=Pseudogymnoascus destructans TaxID=655981 RepID=L8G8E1_PSED2|nr:uncharacterized protein VC83_05855 [Pseudogymnoascus destructans]ELR08913.1 hypothetical protein GMDG_03580 [Pseudogymnoascus destructans 20631-21]OAF57227.1 hypothetical protein VC83_05855 [Pseudogymnoascus destructans]
MADRFPSLEEFDSGAQTERKGEANFDVSSPAGDDFLSRERAVLGEDATQFASKNDKAAFVDDDDEDDLLGGGNNGGEEVTEFQNNYPDVNTADNFGPTGGAITSSNYPQDNEPEPEVVREWRERRDLALQDREEKSKQKKTETIKDAQQNIDDFYDNYNQKKEKTVAQTRREAEEFLANREDTSAGGTSWERIAKLVDLSGKGTKGGASGTGKEKFRELLLNLKKDEKAPGASGL